MVACCNPDPTDLDRFSRINQFLEDYKLYSGQSLHVTKYMDDYYVMERQHDMGGTSYYHLFKIDREEAEWICEQKVFGKNSVTEWMDCLK